MEHGEKMVDGVLIKYLCQPCPECKAKLQAAEEMAKALRYLRDEDGRKNSATQLSNHAMQVVNEILSAWDKAGKGIL